MITYSMTLHTFPLDLRKNGKKLAKTHSLLKNTNTKRQIGATHQKRIIVGREMQMQVSNIAGSYMAVVSTKLKAAKIFEVPFFSDREFHAFLTNTSGVYKYNSSVKLKFFLYLYCTNFSSTDN